MASTVYNPVITTLGEGAAVAAAGNGLSLELTHIAFGTGLYTPTKAQTSLQSMVKAVPIAAGGKITANQCRMSGIWSSETEAAAIGEVGFYAGNPSSGGILFAVWSRETGGPIGVKSAGVDFVQVYDLTFNSLPANSVNVVADAGQSAFMNALMAHEADPNDPHPQYMKKTAVPDVDGTYTKVTFNNGVIVSGENPTTRAGYGITDAAALDHTHDLVSPTQNGFMSNTDKIKLDGLNGNNYIPKTGGTVNGALTGNISATETAAGMTELATQNEVDSQTDDQRIVTPKKLGNGFAINLSVNGYIKLPSWLSGFMIQWGRVQVADLLSTTVVFPAQFNTACFNIQMTPEWRNVIETYAAIGNVTKSQFVAYAPYVGDIEGAGAYTWWQWLAIGK